MHVIIILLCLVAGSVSSCDAAHAFNVEPSKKEYSIKLDANPLKTQAKAFVCSRITCPTHIEIEQFKISGDKFASVKISSKWRF